MSRRIALVVTILLFGRMVHSYGQVSDSIQNAARALDINRLFPYKMERTTFPDTCFIVPEDSTKHYLIGGSYRLKESAINEMRKYMDFGFLPFIIYSKERKVYRIVIDCPLDTREKAERDLENIKKL